MLRCHSSSEQDFNSDWMYHNYGTVSEYKRVNATPNLKEVFTGYGLTNFPITQYIASLCLIYTVNINAQRSNLYCSPSQP